MGALWHRLIIVCVDAKSNGQIALLSPHTRFPWRWWRLSFIGVCLRYFRRLRERRNPKGNRLKEDAEKVSLSYVQEYLTGIIAGYNQIKASLQSSDQIGTIIEIVARVIKYDVAIEAMNRSTMGVPSSQVNPETEVHRFQCITLVVVTRPKLHQATSASCFQVSCRFLCLSARTNSLLTAKGSRPP
ncbi:hypothetical protein CBL_06122 [Carabus blaptoides fortunei]